MHGDTRVPYGASRRDGDSTRRQLSGRPSFLGALSMHGQNARRLQTRSRHIRLWTESALGRYRGLRSHRRADLASVSRSLVRVRNSQEQIRLADDAFAKICQMIGDLSMNVRIEAASLMASGRPRATRASTALRGARSARLFAGHDGPRELSLPGADSRQEAHVQFKGEVPSRTFRALHRLGSPLKVMIGLPGYLYTLTS